MYIYINIYILKENNTYVLKACIYIYSGSMYINIDILKENNIYGLKACIYICCWTPNAIALHVNANFLHA